MASGTCTKCQLEILIRSTSSAIHKFQENIFEISQNVSETPMSKTMLVNKDFQTWFLIGWQLCGQLVRNPVRKDLLTNMDFNKEISQ